MTRAIEILGIKSLICQGVRVGGVVGQGIYLMLPGRVILIK